MKKNDEWGIYRNPNKDKTKYPPYLVLRVNKYVKNVYGDPLWLGTEFQCKLNIKNKEFLKTFDNEEE